MDEETTCKPNTSKMEALVKDNQRLRNKCNQLSKRVRVIRDAEEITVKSMKVLARDATDLLKICGAVDSTSDASMSLGLRSLRLLLKLICSDEFLGKFLINDSEDDGALQGSIEAFQECILQKCSDGM